MRTFISVVVLDGDPNIQAINLDFDFFLEGELKVSKLANALNTSHNHIKKAFEDIVSDEYKKFMKGEIKA
jgi:uncharacterized protein (TIGR04255 family)